MRILVVEDDLEAQRYLVQGLQEWAMWWTRRRMARSG
jgi:hypothetical protein